MFKKILRWLLLVVGVLGVLLAVAVWALNNYLDSRQEKILGDLVNTAGLDVAFRRVDVSAFWTFPRVTVSIDSLVVRDATRPKSESALLSAHRLRGELSLGNLLRDTLQLNHIELSDGGVYIASDSTGNFNFGDLFGPQEQTDSSESVLFKPVLHWDGAGAQLACMDITYLHPTRNKRMEVRLDTLRATVDGDARGDLRFVADLQAFVKGIAFNTEKGNYLAGARMEGELLMERRYGDWHLSPTGICIDDQRFNFTMHLRPRPEKELRLTVVNEETDYATTLALLPEDLRVQLNKHHVGGRFPVHASIVSNLERGIDPLVNVRFALAGHDAQVQAYGLKDVYTSGTFVNHLDESEGGIPGNKKNFRVVLDSSQAYQGPLSVELPHGIIRGTANDVRLEAPLLITGPATDINQRVGTRDFIFERGRFTLATRVDASLNSMEEIIQTSDGTLRLRNTGVLYRPAGVRFPFRFLNLGKRGKDIRFRLQSGRLKTGFTFEMDGTLDNLLPLLLERPADSMRADVHFQAPRLDWTDFLAIFGEDGYFGEEENRSEIEKTAADQAEAMKKALLGLRSTFRPQLEASFDTVAYYDVLALENFTTGIHFNGDTLVLERTAFDWEDSRIDFGARLGLGEPSKTPFRLNVGAERLNLNRLRPSLEYFGLALPEGLDSLPGNLSIGFDHRGIINDTLGIRPGTNVGKLTFAEGTEGLFSGSLAYAPGRNGLKSRLHLQGNPRFVNQLFAAEDFFFGTGRFNIDLKLEETPENLRQLIENSDLELTIDSSQVLYRPGGITVPVRKFVVEADQDGVTYDLQLFSDSIRSSVDIGGSLDRLAAFMFPDSSHAFRVTTDATARVLHWSDIRDFIRAPQEMMADTAAFDAQSLFSATEGVFNNFRPNLHLAVDTFWIDDTTRITELHGGLRMKDSTKLVLEKSGFLLGEGGVEFSAIYDIDRRLKSPFSAKWRTDSLALEDLLGVLRTLEVLLPEGAGELRGAVSMKGNLRSRLNENRQRVMLDSTHGKMDLRISGLELANWPGLQELGSKVKMKKRFETLYFAPLDLKFRVDSGRVWLPRTEIQSSALQLFVEGSFDTLTGPDLLVAVPLRNIGRGVLGAAPATTGYARAGWKVYLVMEPGKDGKAKTKFRLGRRRYFRERDGIEALRTLRGEERAARRAARLERKALRARPRVQGKD